MANLNLNGNMLIIFFLKNLLKIMRVSVDTTNRELILFYIFKQFFTGIINTY